MATIEISVEEIVKEYGERNDCIMCYGKQGEHQQRLLEIIQDERQRCEEAYKKGHADALRTIPIYETNNLTQPNNQR